MRTDAAMSCTIIPVGTIFIDPCVHETAPANVGRASVPRMTNDPAALPPMFATASVKVEMRFSGRLSPRMSTRIGSSSRRGPVTPDNARLIGSVASAATDASPFFPTASACAANEAFA